MAVRSFESANRASSAVAAAGYSCNRTLRDDHSFHYRSCYLVLMLHLSPLGSSISSRHRVRDQDEFQRPIISL